MPSGAKKRKAAKKKKNANPSTNNPQGTNELKTQDEKGSDGGESLSPAYRDHGDDHHHPFHEENEEVEESDPSAAHASADVDAKSTEEAPTDVKVDEARGGKEDTVVLIEQDLEPAKSCEKKDVTVVHDESAKESFYGNGNSGGRSNDETITEKNSKDELNSQKETVTFDELVKSIGSLVKSIDSSHAKMTLITENAPVEAGVRPGASVSDVKGSENGNALQEKSATSQVGANDIAMKMNEDKAYPVSDENVRTSSIEKPKPNELDKNITASAHTHLPEYVDGAEHVDDSVTPEHSENQPLVTPAPHVVRKTSWLTCCGLFEVLTGSDR